MQSCTVYICGHVRCILTILANPTLASRQSSTSVNHSTCLYTCKGRCVCVCVCKHAVQNYTHACKHAWCKGDCTCVCKGKCSCLCPTHPHPHPIPLGGYGRSSPTLGKGLTTSSSGLGSSRGRASVQESVGKTFLTSFPSSIVVSYIATREDLNGLIVEIRGCRSEMKYWYENKVKGVFHGQRQRHPYGQKDVIHGQRRRNPWSNVKHRFKEEKCKCCPLIALPEGIALPYLKGHPQTGVLIAFYCLYCLYLI